MPSHRFTAEECKKTGIWAMTPEERRQHSPAGGNVAGENPQAGDHGKNISLIWSSVRLSPFAPWQTGKRTSKHTNMVYQKLALFNSYFDWWTDDQIEMT